MKLDILAIGAHPDDVELGCSGTLIKHIAKGYKVGVLDLTKGELGTRGSAKTRLKEVEDASKIMGIHIRENLGFEDGFIQNDKAHQLALIRVIRRYKPSIIIANAKYDRHPDHGKSADLTRDASFLSGLQKIETELDGRTQQAHRPKAVYNYVQAIHIEPHFVVDVSDQFDKKLEAIRSFRSQFYNPDSMEPNTFISSPEFLQFVIARASHFGVPIGAKYGEAFTVNRIPGVDDVVRLL